MKPIPTLESVSPEYARLTTRQAELNREMHRVDAARREAQAELGTIMSRDLRRERADALIAGVDYRPPASYREKMARLNDERRALEDAQHEIGNLITAERQKACREITSKFIPDNTAAAARFFKLIAEAAAVHLEHVELRKRLTAAGIDPLGLHDFGFEVLGKAGARNDDIGMDLRAAVRRGYLGTKEIPEIYR
jgi:hypothetical protein